ncbi:MAG TPA: cell division protein, partial [Pseudomonas sp.]|nr:cell division protein [Pseudomonas sp.]
MSKGFDEVFTAVSGADDLLDHYQFTHDPFAPRTPGFRFFTPKRKSVLAELHHLARYGDQVMAVTGPQGSGKTLLRQALVASSNKDSVQCVVLSAREMPAESALLAGLCQAVSAEQRDVASLLRKAQQSEAVGIQLYLVIDDAECLESSAVSMLSEIAEAGAAAPRVFLFADSEAEAALSLVRKSDDAPAVHMIGLQPLDVAETRDYMAQRLEGAGQGIELLDDAQVEWVHQRSGGWPGGINQAARQALLVAMQEAPVAMRRAGGNPFPVKALAALVLIAAGIGVAWYMGDQPQEPERTVLQLPAPVVEAQSQAPVSAPLPGDGTTSGAQNADSAAASEEDAVPTLVDAQASSAPDPAPVQTEAPALDAEPDPAPALTAPAPAPA